jgi:two-component system, cell cycle response regulator DivK
MEDFKAAGINAYLPKPVDFDMLVQTVKQYIS